MAPGSKGRSGHCRGWRWQSSASPGLSPRSALNIVAQTSSHAPGHTPRIWYSVVALKDTDLIVSVNFYIPPYYKSAVSVCEVMVPLPRGRRSAQGHDCQILVLFTLR